MDRPNLVDLTAVSSAALMVSRHGGATDVARALEAIATGDLARLYRVAALVEAHAGYPDGLGDAGSGGPGPVSGVMS